MNKSLIKTLFIVGGVSLFGFFVVARDKTHEGYARRVFEKCRRSEDKASCYDKEIPKLLKNLPMEAVFEVTREVQTKDPSYIYCHVLGHEIASAETKKNPDKWKEVVARCPAGVCSNGCVHGAFQEKFRAENLSSQKIEEIKKDLEDVCEAREGFNPSGLEQGSCYHALGHLFMYITSADIDKSTALCDELTLKNDGRDFRPVCYDGSFMQIFQPLEAEDEVLVYGKVPKKENLIDYCFKYVGEKRYSCWNESWPMSLGNSPTSREVVSFCSKVDTPGREGCYMDIFYLLPIGFEFDFNKMNRFCSEFPIEAKKELCYSTFVQRIIEIDYRNKKMAVDFCIGAQGELFQESCFKSLVFYANFVFHPGSNDIQELCSYFPEKFKESCGDG